MKRPRRSHRFLLYLEENAEDALAELIRHVIFDGGRSQERVVYGEQEEEERLPCLSLQDFRLVSDLLESAQDAVAEDCLSVDDVDACAGKDRVRRVEESGAGLLYLAPDREKASLETSKLRIRKRCG